MTFKFITAYFLASAFAIFSCFAQEGRHSFILNGNISGRDTGRLVLSYNSPTGKFISDTVLLKNGRFTFSGRITEPTMATLEGNLQFPNRYNIYDPNFRILFLEPSKMTIVLRENDFRHAVVTGSATEDENKILQEKLQPYLKTLIPLNNEYSNLVNSYYRKKDTSKAIGIRMDEIKNQIIPLAKKADSVYYDFLLSHPSSFVSADILDTWVDPQKTGADSAMMFYNSVDKKIQNSFQGRKALQKFTSYIKAEQASAQGGSAAIGGLAPDIKLTDKNGNPISLSSLRANHYVLLDFWASWCGPCREGLPQIKDLYKRYHDKGLEVAIISLDFNGDQWAEAKKKFELSAWPQAYSGFSNTSENFAKEKFGVIEIPLYILIDKTGKIIGRYSGLDDAAPSVLLADALATIF